LHQTQPRKRKALKRIKEVAKSLFVDEDIVELDQSELEDRLLSESNKILEPLGVKLNFITLTFDLDEQTRQAIDVATAMKIFRSRGIESVGLEVMKARAGATKVVVETKSENTNKLFSFSEKPFSNLCQ
jgi:hypothetical protein